MASVTFNFSAAQQNRVQEAQALYNAQTGESLTVKQFVYAVCIKPVVRTMLREEASRLAVTADTPSIDTDLEGTP